MYKFAFLSAKIKFLHSNLLIEFTTSSIKSLLIVIVFTIIKKAILWIALQLGLHEYWLIHALELTHEIYLFIIFILSLLFDLKKYFKKLSSTY